MDHEQLLGNLIKIKSYSGEEEEIRIYIADWFKRRRIESFTQEGNLLVHIEGKDRTRAFLTNSHMDTVTEGAKPWKTDPWTPTKIGDKLHGLGASDMKSGLAASMLWAESISKEGVPPVDMWFTYVTEEEVDGSGTKRFADWFSKEGYLRRYEDTACIFTEPTSLTQVEYGHRGNYFLEVKADGPSGHASRPYDVRGKLAVRKMIDFADAFGRAVKRWGNEFPDKYFEHTITVGEMTSLIAGARGIKGVNDKGEEVVGVRADSPNKFADTCVATFDLRTTPESHEILFERVQKLGRRSGVEVGLLYPAAPAGFTDPGERIVQIAKSALGKREIVVSYGSADLGFLTLIGVKSVILGPGERIQSHMTDEFCYPAQIPQAVEVYKAIVEAWAK